MTSKKAENQQGYFIKEAGIMDFFYNIGSKRGRALAIWEKKYPNVAKELREKGIRLLEIADNALANTLAYLKTMATARATRQVDNYVAAANKIKNEYAKFDGGDKGFAAYYNNVVAPFLNRQEKYEQEEYAKPAAGPAVVAPSSAGVPDLNLPAVPVGGTTPTVVVSPSALPQQPMGGPPGASPPFTPPAPEEQTPDTVKDPLPEAYLNRNKVTHQSFYESLQSMSDEDSTILSRYIAKYASSIQKSDLETAIELFDIARRAKR